MIRNKNKKYIQIGFCCLILLSIFFSTLLQADNDAEKKKSSSITLDWEEFQKILKLDVDEVKLTWDEFSKLLSMTGFRFKPEYKVEGGNIILTREQFKKLIDKMKPPRREEVTPPSDYLIRKGSYIGISGKKSTQFTALLELQIFKKERKAYLKIPLFREELAIEDIRFDEKPASIITENGWHYLNTDEVGKHSVRVKFSVKSSLDKGTPGLNFNIPHTPITYILLDIPKEDIEMTIANAQELQTKESRNHTIVEGYLVPTSEISISWKKKSVKIVHGPAKIYAELFNLLSIEADAIRVTTKVKLNILQNKITSITLVIPPGYQVLDVTGQGKNIWNVREEKGKELLVIPFEYPIEGNQEFIIKSEKLLPEETMVAELSGFEVMEAIRESGFIAGEVKSDAEAHIQEFKNLDRLDFQKIPSELSELSSRPMLFAFKYIRHPYNIVVGITKYERAEALSAIIDYARGTTLFNEDGKLVHQFTFSMQNLWNQFLKLELPKEANVWSVYVDGKREKASKDSDGTILIPLVRSQREGEGGSLRSFDVELIYSEPAKKFSIFGKKEQNFPTPDVLINRLEWNLYLPVNYKYIHFAGNLKRGEKVIIIDETLLPETEIEGARGKPAKPSVPEDKEKDVYLGREDEPVLTIYKKSEPIPTPSPPKEKKDAILGEAGLLSVRVNIPVSGKNYFFSKKIIEKSEPLNISVTYVNERVIYWLITLLVLIVLLILFKIRRIFVSPIKALGRFLSKSLSSMKNSLEPRVLPIVILVILILSMLLKMHRYHPLIFIVLTFLFVISLVRLFKNQSKQVLKFLYSPLISSLIILLLLVLTPLALIKTRLFQVFIPLFLLLFIAFIASIIRLIISLFTAKTRNKMEGEDKKVKEEEQVRTQFPD